MNVLNFYNQQLECVKQDAIGIIIPICIGIVNTKAIGILSMVLKNSIMFQYIIRERRKQANIAPSRGGRNGQVCGAPPPGPIKIPMLLEQ